MDMVVLVPTVLTAKFLEDYHLMECHLGAFQIQSGKDDVPRVYQRLDGLTLHNRALKPTHDIEPVQGSALASFLQRVRSLSKSDDSVQ